LRSRDFRLLWAGLAVSAVGTWIQLVALSWLVWELTLSPFYLGLVGFSRAAPVLLLSLVGGVLADRLDRRRLLLATQSVMMALAFLLAVLVALGLADVWTMLAISLLSSVAMAFDMPARHSLVPELVDRDDVISAISLNSAAFNAAGVVGPAGGGVLVASVGGAVCFFLNGVSFLAVVLALLAMRLRPGQRTADDRNGQTLWHGLAYIRKTAPVLGILVATGTAGMLGRPYSQLMPVFAEQVHHVGATGLGTLLSASGLGSVGGALVAASLGHVARKGLFILGGVTLFGGTLVLFAVTTSYAVALGLLVLVGGLNTFYMSTANTTLQMYVPPSLRGRVLSVYTMTAIGFMPLGSMVLGGVGTLVGVPQVVLIGGLATAVVAVLVALRMPSLLKLE
jgi:MFS family permease